MARSAMAAIEPLVELLLELGITSPEAESLLRSLFVHKSREWLARRDGGTEPSDVRISLVTGVHRNFVSRLLSAPPRIAEVRERKGHRATRLLRAWHTQAPYLDGSGKPRDIPEEGPAPSFEALSRAWVPGTAPRVVLRELQRAGIVQRLNDERVRVRARTVRAAGFSTANLAELGRQGRAYLDTLVENLRDPQHPRYCESVSPVMVDAARLPLVREVISRRATAFLQSLEAELASEARRSVVRRRRGRAKISLTVIQTQE